MKRYWFYGTLPRETISETTLTEEQKRIIEQEKKRINNENYDRNWIGFKRKTGWDFMRHGFQVIHIEEERGNIARMKLENIIRDKYYEEES